MDVPEFDTRPALPKEMTRSIGLIGCGAIARHAHLPAYRKFGFRTAAVASRRMAAATELANRFDIPKRYDDWRALIDDPGVDVVDITVPRDEDRLAMVEAAAGRGKHVMMQKPLAHSMEAATHMVELAQQHNVKLAVNHNARWCPQYRAAKLAIERGYVGTPVLISHQMFNTQDSYPSAPDWQRGDRFQLIEYTVHHLDLVRFWAGREPDRVRASIIRKPGQQRRGEMIVSVQLQFGGDLLGVVTDDNAAHPRTPVRSEFHVGGTEGCIDGRVMHEPFVEVRSDRLGSEPYRPALVGDWFPDGFAGTMGELMIAIEQDREPTISGGDNLNTLRLVFAAYRDAETIR